MLKASMTVPHVTIDSIQALGGPGNGPAGHSFALLAQLNVRPRSLGALAGEGIDCPQLVWSETIEWFEFDANADTWIHRGEETKDMYEVNSASRTFLHWNGYRYTFSKDSPNAPAELRATTSEKDTKHWIARNGFQWNLPIVDTPRMGLQGGSGGGGGPSLVIGPSRRRVIHFNLGFTGGGPRAQATQIVETLNGNLTIQKFVNRGLSRGETSDPTNLARWRAQLNGAQHWDL